VVVLNSASAHVQMHAKLLCFRAWARRGALLCRTIRTPSALQSCEKHNGKAGPVCCRLLRRRVEDYEADPDRHHTISNVVLLSRTFSIEDRLATWVRFLTFDALIGNTDRHPENWGFLATQSQGEDWTFSFAPSFDHGTSLAYQLRNEDIKRESSEERIKLHLQRGQHHARWSGRNPERGHFALCGSFAQTYPQAFPAMSAILDFNINSLKELLEGCSRFDLSEGRWNSERGAYVGKLISARRVALREALGA
jgi:HipA-like C-terminal domain